jgi:S1-C subfamily serine protease
MNSEKKSAENGIRQSLNLNVNVIIFFFMKLYSKKQTVLYSLGSAFAAAVFVTILCFAFFSARQKKSADLTDGGFSIETKNEIPSVQVANDLSGGTYTQDEIQNISVYEKCNETVVNITTQVMGYNWFYEPVVTESGSGSGSIIDSRGYVVTNCHVIEKASVITISLADGSSYEGKVVGQDTESDIAVLKFEPDKNTELKTISFGDSENLKVGQKVIAIGNPFALERTLTTGIISGLGRPIQESRTVIIRNMIQTDAAINPGNSGGPLLDTQGKMIGINTMIYSSSGSSSGVGFAIPATTARRVVSDLIKYGKVNRGKLKISLVQNTSRIASYAKYEISTGMIVDRVQKGSRADEAGFKGGNIPVQFRGQTFYLGGDIITAIDDIQVSKLADYYSALEDKLPGDQVTVTVFRNKKYEKLKVILEASSDSTI